jgi:hypothetical protein
MDRRYVDAFYMVRLSQGKVEVHRAVLPDEIHTEVGIRAHRILKYRVHLFEPYLAASVRLDPPREVIRQIGMLSLLGAREHLFRGNLHRDGEHQGLQQKKHGGYKDQTRVQAPGNRPAE